MFQTVKLLLCAGMVLAWHCVAMADAVRPDALHGERDPSFKIRKVYDYINDISIQRIGSESGLSFEQKYYNYGAATQAQRAKRKGHFFVVNWTAEKAAENITVLFEYRQKLTQDRVYRLEMPYTSVKGDKKTEFEVVGEAFEKQGLVNSWRISILKGEKVLAQKKSFVW